MKYFLLAIICFSLYSCCNGDRDVINNGIVREFSLPECGYGIYDNDNCFIIRSDSQLLNLVATHYLDTICYELITDSIDFNEYSLIGALTKGGCGIDKLIRTLHRDDAIKRIIYEVTLEDCGACLSLVSAENTVIIEKVPDDYFVEFAVRDGF